MRTALPSFASSASLAIAVASPLLTACTGTVAGAPGLGGGDAESSVTHAVVLVERTFDPAEGTRAAASARFARVASGVTASDALRAIGAGLDLPTRGSCASIRPVETGAAAEPVPVVDLLDMGHVSVETGGAVVALAPRQLPYVTDVVTGTVYARAAEATTLPAAAPYIVHVAGTGSVAGYDLVAAAPADPSDVVIAQETLPGKIAVGDAALDFAWPRGIAALTGSDAVYVEVQPAGVRCTLGDGSPGAAGETLHASIASSLLDEAGSVVVHRVHAEPFRVGVDDGELRFDFARVVAYAR